MSSNYIRSDSPYILPPATSPTPKFLMFQPIKMYGFQKVSKTQMESITERLQRKTFMSEFYFGERFQALPSPPRPPSTVCKKLKNHQDQESNKKNARSKSNTRTSEEVDEIVQRLCPSRTEATATISDSKSKQVTRHRHQQPPEILTVEGSRRLRNRKLERLARPTASSRDKHPLRYAEDPIVASYARNNDGFYTYESWERPLSRQELDDLIERVQVETVASRGGRKPYCEKLPSGWKERLMATEID